MEQLTDTKLESLFKECNLEDVWRNRSHELDDPSLDWSTVLSLGEQQRLQFCRLLWHFDWHKRHYPEEGFYAVLDEATSALDEMTEEKILKSIMNMDKNLTIIMVTHRVNSLKNCNRIFRITSKGYVREE